MSQILDKCHAAGIEIVSPNFMNQRVLDTQKRMIPTDADLGSMPALGEQHLPEERIFDKAEKAQSLERLRRHEEKLQQHVLLLESRTKQAPDEAVKSRLARRVESIQSRLAEVGQAIEAESPGD
jgi:small conductance mechanosensitive channel